MKRILLFMMLIMPFTVMAQTLVKGKVVDEKGVTIPGVTVAVENGKEQTVSNADGLYQINVRTVDATLIFTSVGFIEKKVSIRDKAQLASVVMLTDTKNLNEVVVVGYGTQKKITVTGAISVVKGEELAKSPTANLGQALVGRTSGLLASQSSGQPGADNVTFRVRGTSTTGNSDPLVLVDGIERPFTEIDPAEVDNLTVLKDAAMTAVYGIRGANGVILVTTKKGTRGTAKVNYSSSFAVQTPTRLPNFLGSYDYATLYNEAAKNDNPLLADSALPFQPDDLQKYKDHSDPILHPDINWFDYMLKKTAPQSRQNVNIGGGTQQARYFVSLSYADQGGLWKEFSQDYGYSNNDNYKRFNFRANTDFDITPSTLVSVSVAGLSGLRHRSAEPFTGLMTSAPLLTPGVVNGKIVQITKLTTGNPIKNLSVGYNDLLDNELNLTFDINQKLNMITNGLSFRMKYGYNSGYVAQNGRTVTPAVYNLVYLPVNGVQTIVFQPVQDASIGGQNALTYSGRTKREYVEAALQYSRSFGKNNIGGLVLFNQTKTYWAGSTYNQIPMGYQGMVGRMTYNYDSRYLLEFNMGYNGSENFPPASRYGWFPAVSVGWNLTSEPWMKNIVAADILSRVKLHSSYGQTGNDKFNVQRYLYLSSEYVSGANAYFGEDQKTYASITAGKLGNPNITWERAIKQDYGIESAFFKSRLTFNFDYFIDYRNDILTARQTIPGYVAASQADGYNIGRVRNKGFDLEIGWKGKIGQVSYFVNGNYTYSRNKVLFTDEIIDPNNPNLSKTGQPVGQTIGLVALGLFNSQAEVDASPVQFSSKSSPGDVKYKDVNGDGVVNEKDMAPIGYPTFPQITYGSTFGMGFKNFDFSVLIQGSADVSRFLGGFMQKPAVQFGQTLSAVMAERWTPDNTANAIRPKLTLSYGASNNYATSTLWMRDGSYTRVKNMEIGYKIISPFLKKAGISGVRVYASGQNLLTFDKLKYVDPENSASDSFQYPQVKVYNIGLTVQF